MKEYSFRVFVLLVSSINGNKFIDVPHDIILGFCYVISLAQLTGLVLLSHRNTFKLWTPITVTHWMFVCWVVVSCAVEVNLHGLCCVGDGQIELLQPVVVGGAVHRAADCRGVPEVAALAFFYASMVYVGHRVPLLLVYVLCDTELLRHVISVWTRLFGAATILTLECVLQ